MKTVSLLAVLALGGSVLAENEVASVCKSMQDIWNCKATFDMPTGAKPKMCPNKSFKYDPCKTKKTYTYPCPTTRKPFRKCNGWTCVPGTHETWIEIPCGIDITMKRVDMCEAVRGALGNAGQQFITKAGAMCQCLPKLVDMVGTTAFEAIESGADVSAAASSLIGDVIDLQKCMIDNGFDIKDNKAEVMAGDLSSQDGWVVIKAAEIDLATYGKLAAAISPCIFGTCDLDLIRSFFTNYLSESRDLMSEQLTTVLEGWVNVFQQIENRLFAVVDASKDLIKHAKTVPGRIEEIEKRICKKKACFGPVMSSFMDKVSAAITTTQAFADAQEGVQEVVQIVPRLVDLTRSAIEVAGATPNLEYILELAVNGKIRKVEDILETLEITKELPRVVNELQGAVEPIYDLTTKLGGGGGQQTLDLLQDVLKGSWESLAAETTAANSTGSVQAGVREIQDIIREELEIPFQNVTDSVSALGNVLEGFPIKKGHFSFHAGVSSYRRWSTVSMDLPCTRTKTQHFTVAGGFKGSFDYPEVYGCPYGPKEVPWPNHHIPYFKFRAVSSFS